MFLFGVAGFTAGDEIAFGAATATNDGDDVIHGQFGGLKFFLAIITDARGLFSFPPLAGPKLPGLGPLPSYFF